MSGNYRKEKNCLNCGHHVEEHYCSHCGQPNLELKEPFWGFLGHSVGHYFHFDSKFFHTMVPLLTRPGQLTLDYLAGKRARYIHPVSLYIFVSIVYFLIVPHALEEKRTKVQEEQEMAVANALNKKHGKLTTKVDQDDLDEVPIVGSYFKELISASDFATLPVPQQQHYIDSLKKVALVNKSDSLDNVIHSFQKILIKTQDSTAAAYLQRQESLPEKKRDSWLSRQLKVKKINAGIAEKENKGGWIKEEMEKYKPKQYFLLMPLLAFFIMVNFRRNHIYYIDHLVFTIHGMTAYFLISILTQPIKKYVFGLDSTLSEIIGFAVFLGIVWYLYSSLKLFYNRTRAVTIRKMITLMFVYWLALFITEKIVEMTIMYVLH